MHDLLPTTQSIALKLVETRREHNLLGESNVCRPTPIGASTPSARSRTSPSPETSRTLPGIRARPGADQAGGRKAEVIDEACRLVAEEGRYHDQFVFDAKQGGAGTTTNMNANEVIATWRWA